MICQQSLSEEMFLEISMALLHAKVPRKMFGSGSYNELMLGNSINLNFIVAGAIVDVSWNFTCQ